MRISDWSSDVCSSDLAVAVVTAAGGLRRTANALGGREGVMSTECRTLRTPRRAPGPSALRAAAPQDAHHAPGEERYHRQGGDGECPQHMDRRSEEHTSELQSLMRISYAVFCLKKKTDDNMNTAQEHRMPVPARHSK